MARDPRIRAALIALHGALLVVLGISAVRLFIAASDGATFFYNSDAVHPFLLAGDVLADPGALFTWYHAPSFNLAPDLIVSAVLVAAGVPAPWQPLLYAGFSAALLCVAIGTLLRTATGTPALVGAWASAAGLFLIGFAVIALGAPPISTRFLAQTVAAFHHGGALIMALAAAACLFAVLRSGKSAGIGLLAGLTALGTVSDVIFVAWFVLPALATLVLVGWGAGSRIRRRAILSGSVITLAATIGAAVESAFNTVRADYLVRRSVSGRISWLSDRFGDVTAPPDLVVWVAIALLIVLWATCARLVLRLARGADGQDASALTLYLGGAAAAACLAPVLLGYLHAANSIRYFLPAFLLPYVWLLAILLRRMPLRTEPRRLAIPGLRVLLAGAAAVLAPPGPPALMREQAALMRCLDKEGRDAAFSDYWNGMAVMHYSGRRLHIVALAADATPFEWNANAAWLTTRGPDRRPAAFDAIAPARLDLDRLRARFGPPDAVAPCDIGELWLYDTAVQPKRRSDGQNQ